MPRSLFAALMASAVLTAGAATAVAAPADLQARAAWSMVDMSKDANGDGFIDGDGGVPRSGALTMKPSTVMVGAGNHIAQPNERLIDGALSWYLSPDGFPVTLDACGSTGTTYSWTLTNTRTQSQQRLSSRPLTAKGCKSRVTLPEGDYSFTLTVASGARSTTNTVTAKVHNILMLALGDSYASGEGNPRNVQAWIQRGGLLVGFRPYWDDDTCNRSVHGAPAQAALALEKASTQTSVTLVDVTCSGATITQGILGQQFGQIPTQLAQARSIIGSSPVDLVTLSIGGNDVGFSSVLGSCLLNDNCPIVPASSGILRSYPSLHAGVTTQTGKLPSAYASINACLTGKTCPNAITLAPGAVVLPTLYPDITRNAAGGSCTYLTMTAQDFAWAQSAIIDPTPPATVDYQTTNQGVRTLSVPNGSLNQQIQATDLLGWRPVTGTWASTGQSPIGHGVCAGSQAWIFGAQLGALSSGSFHPNPEGLRQMAAAITEAAKVALS